METENKQQILKRRKEIEQELLEMLKETESDFGLEDIKDTIYNEEETDDMMKVVAMFDPASRTQSVHYGAGRGGDASELSNILELASYAWNYFPHKSLKGLSPAEKMLEYEKEDYKAKKKALQGQKLTKKQRDLLWGDGGVYSQVNLKKEVRILDDSVSRVFLVVEAEINPTTFEIINRDRHKDELKNDVMIQQLLDRAEHRGPQFGYVVSAFQEEYKDKGVLARAEHALQYTQECIIKMHKYVMDHFT